MHAFVEGIFLGLSLAFIFGFGPAFFALVQTALHRGFWAGVLLALGIFLNDIIVVVLGLLGSVSVIKASENYRLMGIIGGILLIIFGIVTLTRKRTNTATEQNKHNDPHPLVYIGKGFLLNLMNPFVWIFWLTVIVGATASYKADTTRLILFFSGALGVVVSTDIIKVLLASKLSAFVTDKFLNAVNKIAGIALIMFGVFMILRSIYWF